MQTIVPLSQGNRTCRLFCFHYAGGAASAFRPFAAKMGKQFDVFAVQLPGREQRMREAPLSSMETMVAAIGADLLRHVDKPFAFWGHSMGATLAYETSRWLLTEGKAQPYHLVLSGAPSAHLPRKLDRTLALDDEQFFRAVADQYDGIPKHMRTQPALFAPMLPALRADMTACDRYEFRPNPLLDCRLSVAGGKDDPHVTFADLQAWQMVTLQSCEVQQFAGAHFFPWQTSQPSFLRFMQRVLN